MLDRFQSLLCIYLMLMVHWHCGSGSPQSSYTSWQQAPYSYNQDYNVPQLYNGDRQLTNTAYQLLPANDAHIVIGARRQHQQPVNAAAEAAASPTSYSHWTSPPIVVEDNHSHYDDYAATAAVSSSSPLQPKTARNLYSNHRALAAAEEHQVQQVPPNLNYPNPAVYRSSDVWRQHQQRQLSAAPASSEQMYRFHNRPQSPPLYPQYPQSQTPYSAAATSTPWLRVAMEDLNYPQTAAAVASASAVAINQRPHFSDQDPPLTTTASVGSHNSIDYAEHFKEYLRKNPRRIKPIY